MTLDPRGGTFFVLGFCGILTLGLLIGPPPAEPNSPITIAHGATVSEAARTFKTEGAVRSAGAFALAIRLMNPGHGAAAGTYAVSRGESALSLAYRVAHGTTGVAPIKVTIPEGMSSREIGDTLKKALGDFDTERFTALAKPEEGFLFPDTYLLTPGMPPEAVIESMKDNFFVRTAELEPAVERFGKSLRDVIIMASLLEKEARQTETRRTVAGILWKRIDRRMPLQVDAVFGYIMGTTTYSPTFAELTIDSPYNTYRHLGLPPGPIGNPGLDAIEAAVTPVATPYYFYLTGADGTMHYAKTHDEHVANRKYLR